MSTWSELLATLRRWRAERLPHALFVPAAVTIALASAVSEPLGPVLLWRVLLAWASIGLCRLWDDLEDRARDRVDHPDRVWLGAFPMRLGALVASGLLGIAVRAPGMLVLGVALFTFYRLRRGPSEAVLLLKYPAMVAVLHGGVDGPVLGGMLVLYGALLADADLHTAGRAVHLLGTIVLLGFATLAVWPVLIGSWLASAWMPTRTTRVAAVAVQILSVAVTGS